MKTNYFYSVMAGLAIATVICFARKASAQVLTGLSPLPDSFIAGLSTTNNLEANAISNRIVYLNQFTNETALRESYRKNLVTKGEFIWMQMQWENAKTQGIYGKVIDQYGQPIAGVNVIGSVAHRQGWYADDKWDKYKTQSDAEGLFQFTGLTGADWAVNVEKKGYEMDYRLGWAGPRGGPHGSQTTPSNRAILTMWKIQGPEPMVHPKIHAYVSCDGSTSKFNLLTGKKDSSGDLIVSLTRNPVNIVRGKPFDWTLTIEIPSGGLQEITNLYPNEAPEDGYQSTIILDFPTNMVGWQPEFNRAYYFKSKDGRVYGRATLEIISDFQPPPTYFGMDIYANPAGSRNLEFDYKRQVR